MVQEEERELMYFKYEISKCFALHKDSYRFIDACLFIFFRLLPPSEAQGHTHTIM